MTTKSAAQGRSQATAEAVASLIAEQYLSGATLQECADWLTRHRVMTPGGKLAWRRQQVHRLVRQTGLRGDRRGGGGE